MSDDWESDFWDETESDSGALKAAQESSIEDRAREFVAALTENLGQVFPDGHVRSGQRPITTARQMGDHWVGFIGSTPPGKSEIVWSGFWRQDVAVLQNNRRAPGSRGRGASIEKATKVIRNAKQGALWLLWVHRNICKVSGETIRTALHPDNFLKDRSRTFRAAYDCHLIGADFDDLEDIIVQRLPWKTLGPKRQAVTLFRNAQQIGMVGCRYKDQWTYGGTFKAKDISPMFAMDSDPKFKHLTTDASCPTEDDAIKRAERLYAKKVFAWLLKYGQVPGLRKRG